MIKIACTGTHCTGKTTLMNMLTEKLSNYKIHRITDITRKLKQEYRLDINEQGDKLTQVLGFSLQFLEQLKCPENTDFIISDRALIDCIAYTNVNTHIDSIFKLSWQYFAEEAVQNYWDIIIHMVPVINIQKDGVRSENEVYRQNVHNEISKLLERTKDDSSNTKILQMYEDKTLEGTLNSVLDCLKNDFKVEIK